MANSTLFSDPGGEHYFGFNASNIPGAITAGWWNEANGVTLTNAAAPGRSTTYAIAASGGGQYVGKYLATNYGHLIAGECVYTTASTWIASRIIMAFTNGTTVVGGTTTQLDVQVADSSGHLKLTNSGTQRGSTSTQVLTPGYHYIELDTTFATGATGTADVWVDGVRWIHATSVITATTVATANRIYYGGIIINQQTYLKDMYCLDASTGPYSTPLGDITVGVSYENSAGTNAQWTHGVTSTTPPAPPPPPFTLTSVNGSGVYQGTITGGGSNNYAGYNFNVTGFVNGANNVTGAVCTASSATSLTLTATTTIETHAGSAAFQCPVQDGINHLGTWPDDDVAFIYDSVSGHKTDFGHQALTLSGTLFSVHHVTYARKDDAGAISINQYCISGGTTETSAAIVMTNTYLYSTDILDNDPNTSAQWTGANFNAATFGVKIV